MLQQLAFDLDELTRSPYAGPAPAHFTAEYFTPDELLAAHAEGTRLAGGVWPRLAPNHTWDLGITTGYSNRKTVGHTCVLLDVDLRCDCWPRFRGSRDDWDAAGGCQCVGSLLYQANCPDCRWHAFGEENEVVEAWHDHAWPGWRDLPVLPFDHENWNVERSVWSKKASAWIEENQPTEWRVSGAPLLTQRQKFGTRHVPGRSPWGGFDLSSTAVGGELKVWP